MDFPRWNAAKFKSRAECPALPPQVQFLAQRPIYNQAHSAGVPNGYELFVYTGSTPYTSFGWRALFPDMYDFFGVQGSLGCIEEYWEHRSLCTTMGTEPGELCASASTGGAMPAAGDGCEIRVFVDLYLMGQTFGTPSMSVGSTGVICRAGQLLGTLVSNGMFPTGTQFCDMNHNALDVRQPVLAGICAYLPAGDRVLAVDFYSTNTGVEVLESTRFVVAKFETRVGEVVKATGYPGQYAHVTIAGILGSRVIPWTRSLRNIVPATMRFVRLQVHVPRADSVGVRVDVQSARGVVLKTMRLALALHTPLADLVEVYKMATHGSVVRWDGGALAPGTQLRDLLAVPGVANREVCIVVCPPDDATESDSDND